MVAEVIAALPSPVGAPAVFALKSQGGMLHHWPFEELTGNPVDVVNGVAATGGAPGAGWIYGGREIVKAAGDFVTVTPGLDEPGYALSQWSISLVAYIDEPSGVDIGYYPVMLNYGFWEPGRATVYVQGTPYNDKRIDAIVNGVGGSPSGALTIYDTSSVRGRWLHIVVTCNGSRIYAYLNGVQFPSYITFGQQLKPLIGDDFGLGGLQGHGSYFNGRFDELAVWGKALSAAEVQALYESGPVGAITEIDAHAALLSPVGACSALALVDYGPITGDKQITYAMELITPGGPVRVPMSSWQATLQVGRSSFVQAVIPACLPWVATIGTATEFVVYRVMDLPGAGVVEYEMARSALTDVRFDRGALRYTCTISGWADGFALDENPSPATDRTLQRLRSFSLAGGQRRVRCDIDWLLRPGQRVTADGEQFVAAYINYYVGQGDAYMDVGERI